MVMAPDEVHSTHDVREEGLLVSDPVCQTCRLSVHGSSDMLRLPCGGPATARGGHSPQLVEQVALAILNSDRSVGGWPPLLSRATVADSEGYVRNALAVLDLLHPQDVGQTVTDSSASVCNFGAVARGQSALGPVAANEKRGATDG